MNAWFIENSGHLTQDGLGTAMKNEDEDVLGRTPPDVQVPARQGRWSASKGCAQAALRSPHPRKRAAQGRFRWSGLISTSRQAKTGEYLLRTKETRCVQVGPHILRHRSRSGQAFSSISTSIN
jgi:hypothetical protein